MTTSDEKLILNLISEIDLIQIRLEGFKKQLSSLIPENKKLINRKVKEDRTLEIQKKLYTKTGTKFSL